MQIAILMSVRNVNSTNGGINIFFTCAYERITDSQNLTFSILILRQIWQNLTDLVGTVINNLEWI
ncbi:MAG: hypothetical protein HY272_02500 [Gammaproteobacteria bacterium]|nr:hypothetical protein [Gammaproteobacteria bacterium]